MINPANPAVTSIANAFSKSLVNPEREKEQEISRKKIECINQGGKWDDTTQTCKLPTPEEIKTEKDKSIQQPTQPPPTDDPVLKLSREKGLSLSAAADILLAKQQQSPVKQLARRTTDIQNAMAQQREQQIVRQQQMSKLLEAGRQGLLTPQELQQVAGAEVDIGEALAGGVAGALPGVAGRLAVGGVGAAGLGAMGGAAAAGAPVLATAAAALAVGGFLSSVRSNLRNQQSDAFAADQNVLKKGSAQLRALITDTNRNPQNAVENIQMFYSVINAIDIAHAKTRKDSQENLNKFLGKNGLQELEAFETFDTLQRNFFIRNFENAIMAPNPNALMVTEDDFLLNGTI